MLQCTHTRPPPPPVQATNTACNMNEFETWVSSQSDSSQLCLGQIFFQQITEKSEICNCLRTVQITDSDVSLLKCDLTLGDEISKLNNVWSTHNTCLQTAPYSSNPPTTPALSTTSTTPQPTVCSSTRQMYHDTACCGGDPTKQNICASKTVDFGDFSAKLDRIINLIELYVLTPTPTPTSTSTSAPTRPLCGDDEINIFLHSQSVYVQTCVNEIQQGHVTLPSGSGPICDCLKQIVLHPSMESSLHCQAMGIPDVWNHINMCKTIDSNP